LFYDYADLRPWPYFRRSTIAIHYGRSFGNGDLLRELCEFLGIDLSTGNGDVPRSRRGNTLGLEIGVTKSYCSKVTVGGSEEVGFEPSISRSRVP
jgi:hypothetical protein